ncbi:hypothetical protein UPYG_G00268710 [Umbra pygmaea]|uniref:Calponin-homology (CH) domain-containing protein n=1 Tax=Umbra pygmaea TaxID=75934 RepID=A0ABD0WAF9_UMBPY
MPAILVASKMKSGLPKPVHSALPIPQLQSQARPRTYSPHKASYPRQSLLKVTHQQGQGTSTGGDNQENPQIYTDWANHHLVKSGHKRLIKDLQQDVTDGVLLAEIIQVVANEKIEDINGYPKSRTQMIDNIDTCLGFLAAKGVNIQGLSAEEIRKGNLKTILGLFFSLSRYKQQQVLKQQSCLAEQRPQPLGSPAPPHTQHPHSSTGAAVAHKAPADMLSRLPGPAMRVPASGSEEKQHGASSSNRRSQSFNHYEKPRPSNTDQDRSTPTSPVVMEDVLSPGPSSISTLTSTPPPRRSKSLNAKHSATSSMLSIKQDTPTRQTFASPLEVPPKVIAQKSMLEKLKLFNSKGGSKAAGVLTDTPPEQGKESMEVRTSAPTPLEVTEGNTRPHSTAMVSPKLALKGIAQRTFSRALTPRKSSLKPGDKDKDKARPTQRDKPREGSSRRGSVTKLEEPRDASRLERPSPEAPDPKWNSKTTSFIPKGGKAASSKKESSAPAAHSGIPKPGSKPGKSSGAPSSGRDGDRPRSLRAGGGSGLSVHKGQLDNISSSSCSSLASSEGRCHHQRAHTAPPVVTTSSNTISVQLPQPLQQYNHPNTATVAPFMYRSQPDVTVADMVMEATGSEWCRDTVAFSRSAHNSLEDITAAGEEPEARRLRTVKNIADLRQNLEETMSSLRGTQVIHRTLDNTFDTTDVTGKGLLNACPCPNPALPWRLGPSSPRLQAGDAPSVGNGYAVALRSNAKIRGSPEGGRFLRTTQAPSQENNDMDVPGKMDDLVGIVMETSGYVSDGDVLGNNFCLDNVSKGYITDGGLSLYTQRLNRLPDGMAAVRETLHRENSKCQADVTDSWDDSSSVSSGISDTDEIYTGSSVSSYVNTPSVSYKDLGGQLQTDAEKHSVVMQNSVWSGSEEVKRSDGGSDSGVKMESGPKWCRHPSDMSDESDRSSSGRRTPSLAPTGSWRRGMSTQVGVTSPRTKAPPLPGCGSLKTPGTGKTDDAKVSEKGQHHLSPRATGSIQHSPSDTSRSSGDELKKPSSSSCRTPTTNTFGFKKPAGGAVSMVTASGVTVTSGSATLGKIPKSVQLHGVRGLGRQASVDDAYLPVRSHNTLQYRSLPRPSRASGGGRSTSIDSNLSSRTNKIHGHKSYSQVPKAVAGGIPLPGSGSNQTDREKGGSSEASPIAHGPATPTPQAARQPGGKYPDVSSPTLRRLFGGKQGKQQTSVSTSEQVKSSTVISNHHASSGHQGGALDSPSASSGGSSPLYGGGRVGLEAHSLSPLASSPGSALSTPTHSLGWSSTVSRDTLSPGPPSLSSLASSSESMDVSLGSGGHGTLPACVRNNGLKTGLSDRYGHLRSHDDPRDWLRSLSAGGLQESSANAPFSPASSLTSPSGPRFNFSQLGSPTSAAQINLANLRSGLANQEGPYDPSTDPRLRNSSMSLEEKSRTMSSSGSFKDGLEEVHGSSLSLVSSSSSVYSTPEEKSHSEIRKLRRELDASQEKVSALTNQLSANAHLVAAFEQSLRNMTVRLQGLTTTAEQKDSELNALRNSIEQLKKQNTAAQAAVSSVIHLPETPPRPDRSASANGSPQCQVEKRIHRQHSSDSVSSITSATSHSSAGSNLEQDAKSRKKRKNWLRSSFKQAFGKKKSPKSASSHSDIEEIANCSLPSSPKLAPYNGSNASTPMQRNSQSNSLISEFTDSEAEAVMALRTELRDKEMKLTDIRLEALSSAHQLDQLRESMTRMQEYIFHVDPVGQLGLNSDSVLGYSIRDVHRTTGAETPELLPCGYLVGDSDTISVSLKGVFEHSQDSLVFETLIPKPLLQSYVSQLREHRRLILSGPSGTGKSFLASRLAEHMVLRQGRDVIDGTIATFNIDHKSSKELRQYLSNLADQCSSVAHGRDLPMVLILDNLHHVSSLGELFNGLLSCKPHCCPYIIGTTNQTTLCTPNLQLHHNFRWVLCVNHTEPVKGLLGRFLRRKLMETEITSRQRNTELVRIIEWIPAVWNHLNSFLESHSSSDVTIGPRLFLSCPMDVEGSRVWFTDLWNYSIIPYMLEAVREGLQLYGRRAVWEDPARWVMESYPWAATYKQHEWPQLLQLRPVDVGFDGYSISKDGCPNKQLPLGDTDPDPLMNMLIRLKEAAQCSSRAQSYDSDSNSNLDHHDDTILDSSLESTP